MKPEKQEQIDGDDKYIEIGVPKEWIDPLKALGYTTVAKLKEVEKLGKLANDLNGYKKKNKYLKPNKLKNWRTSIIVVLRIQKVILARSRLKRVRNIVITINQDEFLNKFWLGIYICVTIVTE